jgi:hypothetical protein
MMHWWFSGKIGRCHQKFFFRMSASPGFDSRPMHGTALSSFVFCSFCQDFHLGAAGSCAKHLWAVWKRCLGSTEPWM